MISNHFIRVQGRSLSGAELIAIQNLIDDHPDWSRHRVALELCRGWQWRTPLGQLKTFAARSLLLKLAQQEQLRLPALRLECRRVPWGLGLSASRLALPPTPPVFQSHLGRLQPLH